MAYRNALKNVALTQHMVDAARTAGGAYVYNFDTTTEASVYSSAADTSAETQPMSYNDSYGLEGYVEAGRYTVSAGGVTQNVEVHNQIESTLMDPDLGVSTLPRGFYDINTDIVPSTGVAHFVKLQPVYTATAVDTFAIHTGATADNTITFSRCGLYTTDGTTLTRVALSAADATCGATASVRDTWTIVGESPATYTLQPNTDYYWAFLWTATTAPSIYGMGLSPGGAAVGAPTATQHPSRCYTIAAQTALDATETISGLTASFVIPYVHAYTA